MARIDRKKLPNSAWTAVEPRGCEKHFRVHSLVEGRGGRVRAVRLQALVGGAVYVVELAELEDEGLWRRGWT